MDRVMTSALMGGVLIFTLQFVGAAAGLPGGGAKSDFDIPTLDEVAVHDSAVTLSRN